MSFSDATGPTLELSKDRAGRFVNNTRRRTSTQSRKTAQAIIHAELAWSDTATALGIVARSSSPLIHLCGKLISSGVDPETLLEAWRGHTLALKVSSIGVGARLCVKSAGNGPPLFAPDRAWGGAIAPLVDANSPAGGQP